MMNQEQVDIKTPEFVSLHFKLAGLGSRGAAMIIDQLILTAANILVVVLLFYTSDMLFLSDISLPLVIAIISLFIINWGYFFVGEYFFFGKTIGKNAMGIRVIQENGHSITLLAAIIRNLLRIVDMLPTGYFFGMIWVFFHSKHKRLGDLAAGTIVVHERKAKRKNKHSMIENEIASRGLSKDSLDLEKWAFRSLGEKEWKLIKTYSNRLLQLPATEQLQLTGKVAVIIFPKIGLEIASKSNQELENTLLILYLKLKDEWEFEL